MYQKTVLIFFLHHIYIAEVVTGHSSKWKVVVESNLDSCYVEKESYVTSIPSGHFLLSLRMIACHAS